MASKVDAITPARCRICPPPGRGSQGGSHGSGRSKSPSGEPHEHVSTGGSHLSVPSHDGRTGVDPALHRTRARGRGAPPSAGRGPGRRRRGHAPGRGDRSGEVDPHRRVRPRHPNTRDPRHDRSRARARRPAPVLPSPLRDRERAGRPGAPLGREPVLRGGRRHDRLRAGLGEAAFPVPVGIEERLLEALGGTGPEARPRRTRS